MKKIHVLYSMKKLILLFALAAVLTISCKKESSSNPKVRLEFKTSAGSSSAISINQTITHPAGYPYKVYALKYYISGIELVDQFGYKRPIKIDGYSGTDKQVFLYELSKNEVLAGTVVPGTYKKINFYLGLDSITNNVDPNQFASGHPLSRNSDMFWEMTKYRFIVLEGAADTLNAGTFNHVFTYHIGGNQYLKTVELSKEIVISDASKTYTLPIELNLNGLFNADGNLLDIRNFFSFHSAGIDEDKGMQMIQNASKSFK